MNTVMFPAMLSSLHFFQENVVKILFHRRSFLYEVKKMEQKWN